MGLGYIGGNFQVVNEDEYDAMQQQELMMDDQRADVGAAGAQATESGWSVVGGNACQGALDID